LVGLTPLVAVIFPLPVAEVAVIALAAWVVTVGSQGKRMKKRAIIGFV